MIIAFARDFITWREEARKLLQDNIKPEAIIWNETNTKQQSLFPTEVSLNPTKINFNIPATFLKLAETVCHHRDPERFNSLYHMLWRLVHENKNLLYISSDSLTNMLELMHKSVRRDVHKTKAFVRFRKSINFAGVENFIAWHKPDHYSLPLSAPFFKRRFSVMCWTILTPDQSVYYDGNDLHFGPGAKASDAPNEDLMEELWKEFYRAIFNPSRIKIKAMKKEMPVRHWATLPEAKIINEMLAEAPKRVEKMIKYSEGYAFSASDFIPNNPTLENLKIASKTCQGCPLYYSNHHTALGIGTRNAKLMIVCEQPDDIEDKTGIMLISEAGKLLKKALKDAEINKDSLYITYAVKHFKFAYDQGKRQYKAPNLKDITNCRPWLIAEIKQISPKIIVCLGLTASRSLINSNFKQANQGKFIKKDGLTYLASYDPLTILNSENAHEYYRILVENLKIAYQYSEI